MFHTLIVVGNLGSDPELRYTPSGSAVCSFSVATSRKYTSGDELVQETCWFRVTAWDRTAENITEYLKKGSSVVVEGYLRPDHDTGAPRLWTDQSGNVRSSYEMTAMTVRFLGGNVGDAKQSTTQVEKVSKSAKTGSDRAGSDEIPF